MYCEKCGKNPANVMFRQNINGQKMTFHLCNECAEKLGYADLFSGMGNGFENVLGNILGEGFAPETDKSVCPKCGTRYSELVATGKIGCAECYRHFMPALLTSIHRIHGKTGHVGKIPKSAGTKARLRSEISEMRQKLDKAIEEQNFEDAAKLRDAIRELEGGKE